MNTSPIKLMIPGPIQPDQAVLDAMSNPVVPHYGDEWAAYYNDTLALLRSVFNTNGDVFIMVGSGTAAIDACIGSATQPGEKILIGINGFFGERLKTIAECYGLNVVSVTADPRKPLQAKDFVKAFQQHPDAVTAAAVHLETSTAVVNPVDQIGAVAREHGACFIVDAVSSLGGMTYRMDDWCIDLCASASQKCLGAPPGLAPLAVGPRGWQAVDRHLSKTCGFYTNLAIWRKYAEEWKWHPSPITMAVNNVKALRTSLDQLLEEGIENRLERYKELALHLRAGLRKIGMQPFTPDEAMSPVLTAAYPPEGVSVGEIMSTLENKYRIKIAPGLGALAGKIFRIGHMSPVVTMADIDELLEALAACSLH